MISTAKLRSGQADKIFLFLKKKMSSYETTCALAPNLNMLMNAILTIRTVSKQNERKFSTSGIFVKKQRSSLLDTEINALCVSELYFKGDNF
jgi:hypothetical protein